MEVKLSYHKRFDKEGTVYSQAIRIDRKTLDSLNNSIHSEIIHEKMNTAILRGMRRI